MKGQRDVTRVSIAFWKTMREPFGQHIGYSATWEYVNLLEPSLDGLRVLIVAIYDGTGSVHCRISAGQRLDPAPSVDRLTSGSA